MTALPGISLPPALAERVRVVAGRAPAGGPYVLYWMRAAMRGHENPALDVAAAIARTLGLGFFVYQGLDERHPWASDRHHAFILEGARDVARELRDRGVGYAFHLARPGHRGPWLRELGRGAAVVVTEDVPVPFLDRWTERLAEAIPAPVLAVDASCVVPMRVAGRAFDRAFAYREATAAEREARIARPWSDEPTAHAGPLPPLPFEPFAPEGEEVLAAIAGCGIDHGVAPVPAVRGGSEAGYARWQAFREAGLERYARDRNDPLRDGTSRLSPWLHYGMVSPFRIAREAAAEGADKFLDELLVWRELAWTWCRHVDDPERLEALPGWARQTLIEHAADPRPERPSLESLERSRTGIALWDAMQTSLRVHGELHNNLRMTWGKALAAWSPSPEAALRRLVDLNHRYALDGRDPASYGGLLWCLGLFDRPFPPARPVLGTVRARPIGHHARRLDVAAYARRVARPAVADAPRVAIVGSGVAGLSCARTLEDHGLEVQLFERATRVGGRLTTRTTPDGRFDHGAQYFTARDPAFERELERWIEDGRVAPWDARFVRLEEGRIGPPPRQRRRYVGVPDMSVLTARLAEGLPLALETAIVRLHDEGATLRLEDAAGVRHGPFDVVVLAVPPAGVLDLAPEGSVVAVRAAAVTMLPCMAAMLRFEAPFDPGFDAAFVEASFLGFVARNPSKPGRGPEEWWTLHARPDWSREAVLAGRDKHAVARDLEEEFARVLGRALPATDRVVGHRWGNSLPEAVLEDRALLDGEGRLGACGDWCAGPRVEGAWLSGRALAGRILGHHGRSRGAPRRTVETTGSLFP